MTTELHKLLRELPAHDWWGRQKAIKSLISHPEKEYITYLEAGLRNHEDADIRNTAMEVYKALGARSFPSLSMLLEDDDPEVRLFAVNILCEIADARAVPLLRDSLHDEDVNVRCATAEALGRIGDGSATRLLKEVLGDETWVAMAAIGAIGEIGGEEALNVLYECLARGAYREAAILALEKAGDRNSIRRLTPCFSDEKLKELALRAIIKIAERERIRPQPEYFISLAPLLIEMLDSQNQEMKKYAFMALCWSKDIVGLQCLLEGVRDEELQEYAIEGLLSLGRKAVCGIVDELKGSEGRHRVILAKVLSMIGENMALLQFAADQDPEVRTEVALAIASLDMSRAAESLKKMLSDPCEEVRAAARMGLNLPGSNG